MMVCVVPLSELNIAMLFILFRCSCSCSYVNVKIQQIKILKFYTVARMTRVTRMARMARTARMARMAHTLARTRRFLSLEIIVFVWKFDVK